MGTLAQTQVATFEQVEVMKSRAAVNKAAIAGACHCISIHWCSLLVRSPGDGAKDRMRELGVASGRRSAILQNVFTTRWGTDGMEGADFLVLKDNRVESDTTVPYSAYSIDSTRHALSGAIADNAKFGAAFIYSFWFDGAVRGAEGGAHTIAFYCTRQGPTGIVHLFDPNFGEFICLMTDFKDIHLELLRRYGPVKFHNLRRIRPC